MAEAAGKRWLRLCYGRIPQQVGSFYERLTLQITEGTAASDAQIDIEAWGVEAGIEVKGCDDTHAVRIPTDQLERHAGLANFPFARVLYFIYRYRNRRPKGGTGLSRARGAANRSRYLFSATTELSVIDQRVFTAIALTGGRTKVNALPLDPERSCLIVPHSALRNLFAEDRRTFARLSGLLPADWQATSREMTLRLESELEPVETSFTVRTLLPRDSGGLGGLLKTDPRIAIRLPALCK